MDINQSSDIFAQVDAEDQRKMIKPHILIDWIISGDLIKYPSNPKAQDNAQKILQLIEDKERQNKAMP